MGEKRKFRLTAEQQALAAGNTGLIGEVLRRRFWGIPVNSDLWQEAYAEGMLALCRAACGYRPETGWRFSTYATVAIQNWLTRWQEVEGRRGFRLTGGRTGLAVQPDEEWWDGVAGGADDPTDPPPAAVGLGRLEPLVGRLDARLQLVVRHVYDLGEPVQGLGDRMGVSRERGRQLHHQALGRLREMADEKRAA